MAVRIRLSGEVVCAAMHPPEPGDQYVPDDVHYELSAVRKLLVTEPRHGGHAMRGLWWWRDEVPEDVVVDDFYGVGVNQPHDELG